MQVIAPLSHNLKLLDSLKAAFALIVLLFIAYFVQMGLFNPQGLSLFWEHQLRLFLYDIGAVTVAIPISYWCSRIGFFDWPASVLVGCVIGLCTFWCCSMIEGFFPHFMGEDDWFGSAFHVQLSFLSSGYGIVSSAVFREMLVLLRPEAFCDSTQPKIVRIRNLFFLIALALPCVFVMNAARWVPSIN